MLSIVVNTMLINNRLSMFARFFLISFISTSLLFASTSQTQSNLDSLEYVKLGSSLGNERELSDIKEYVQGRGYELEDIFDEFCKIDARFGGDVVIRLIIDSLGGTLQSSVEKSDTGNKDFDNRILSQIKKWNFGRATVGTTTILYTFNFTVKPIDPKIERLVNKQMGEKSDRLQLIYDRYSDAGIDVNGVISFSLSVERDGSLSSVVIIESSTGNEKFDKEISKEIAQWKIDGVSTRIAKLLYKTDFKLQNQNGNRSLTVASFIPNFKIKEDSAFSCFNDSLLFEELYTNIKQFNTVYYTHQKAHRYSNNDYNGTAVIEFYIQPNGVTKNAHLLSSTFKVLEVNGLFVDKVATWNFSTPINCRIGVELTYTIIEKKAPVRRVRQLPQRRSRETEKKTDREYPIGKIIEYTRTDSIYARHFAEYYVAGISLLLSGTEEDPESDYDYDYDRSGVLNRKNGDLYLFMGVGYKYLRRYGRFDVNILACTGLLSGFSMGGNVKYHFPLIFHTSEDSLHVLVNDSRYSMSNYGNRYITVPGTTRRLFNLSGGITKNPCEYILSYGLNYNGISSTRIKVKDDPYEHKGFSWFEIGFEWLQLLSTKDELDDNLKPESLGYRGYISWQPSSINRDVLMKYNCSVGYLRGLMFDFSMSISTSFYGDN